MHNFWDQIILSNPLRKYLFVAIAILIGLLFKRLLSKIIAGILYRAAARVGSGIDKDAFVKLLIGPLETFLLIFITVVSLEKLHFPEEFHFEIYEVSLKTIIQSIAKTVLIGVFIWLLMRTIDFIGLLLKQKIHATGDMKDHQLVVFFRDFLKAIIAIIGVLMILGIAFGFEVSKFWTSLGIAGAALALSAKESIENLIASFIIFFDKPFTAGDVLKVQNITGTVEKIGLRSTRIRTDLKTYVTVPNKQMVDSIVDNQTLRTQRKAEIRLQIGLSASPSALQSFVGAVEKILIREEIENPTVFLNDIAGNAFMINVDFFTAPIALKEFNKIKQEVNLEILKLMQQSGLEIAGASTDVKIINSQKEIL
ncbi:MAG: mechanosensitive ion channel [Bacteroidetes bacterium]|nr:mechanosensitive ion channel [Bacteroidota bacterium]